MSANEEGGSGVAEEEVAALAALFYDANSGAATDLELSQLLTALRAAQVPQPGVPPFLSALWRHSRRWHLVQEHCEAFGLNIFPPDRVLPLVLQVFGDQELVEQWRGDHPTPNTAEPGWVCFASYSEYDFLFTCMDTQSPHFGAMRHVVNNCWEDQALPTRSAAAFIRQLRRFAEAATAPYDGEDGCNDDVSFGSFIMNPDA